MKPGLYDAVSARANGKCEGCGYDFTLRNPPHADHFFGRTRVEESESTVWLLCLLCDHAKTNNSPSAAEWLKRFMVHAEKYGYRNSYDRAFKELGWRTAKKAAGQ